MGRRAWNYTQNTEDIEQLLSVLEKEKEAPPVLPSAPVFKVDRDFETQNEKINQRLNISDEERLLRSRLNKLNDKENRFILDTQGHIIHDRECPRGLDVPAEYFDMAQKYEVAFKNCKCCQRRALIRNTVKDEREIDRLELFFRKSSISRYAIHRLLSRPDVRIRLDEKNVLFLNVGEDEWLIKKDKYRQTLTLLHNSYIIQDKNREMTGRHHIQIVVARSDFDSLITIMLTYEPDYHIEEQEKEWLCYLEQAPANNKKLDCWEKYRQIAFNIPIMVRLNKSLFKDRYIYIDTSKNYGKEMFEQDRIHYRIVETVTGKEFDYRVIVCDIFKWRRKYMDKAAKTIRRRLNRDCPDTYICGQQLIKMLREKGIRFETLPEWHRKDKYYEKAHKSSGRNNGVLQASDR